MYTVVTGAAGFIGSNLVRGLNARGENAIIAVDNLQQGEKFANLADCRIADYLDQDEFLERLGDGDFDDDIEVIFHQGACSDTMEADGRFMMRNNYRYSVSLFEWCQGNDVQLIYASSAAVYGGGPVFREDPACEAPLNVYGYSKLLFDQYVRDRLPERTAPVVGLRYFNVYGPREAHKGRMASVVFHFANQYRDEGRVRLFEGGDGFAAGLQRRDFVSVDDVVEVNLDLRERVEVSGVFNVGSGRATTFNDIATATINAVRAQRGDAPLPLNALVADGAIVYIPFPPALLGKYQSHTEADMTRLRAAGYQAPFAAVADGVPRYVEWLSLRDR